MPILLANFYLLFGLVALVPLMLHLLHKRRPQPIMFAAMRFLSEAIAKSRRARRITQCLTLIMRILIIMLLAFAFSRPVVKFSRFVPGNFRTVLIVLDCSASMQAQERGGTIFEANKRWVDKLLETLGEGDRVALLAPGAPDVEVVFPPVSDVKAVQAALIDVHAGYGSADLAGVIFDKFSKNIADLHGAEVHVFSDFQSTSWPEESASKLSDRLKSEGAALFFNRSGVVTTGDAGVAKVDFLPSAILPGSGVSANVTLHSNEEFAGNCVLQMELESGEKNHISLEIMPGEDTDSMLNAQPSVAEVQVAGTITKDADAYALNDSFYFSLPCINGVPTLVVSGNNGRDAFFLDHALKPGGSATVVDVVDMDWNSFLASDVGNYHLAFICNPSELGEAARTRIGAMLSGGGTVVIFPGDSNSITDAALGEFSSLKGIKLNHKNFAEAKRVELNLGEKSSLFAQRLNSMLPLPWGFTARSILLMNCPDAESVLECEGEAFAIMAKQNAGTLVIMGSTANRDWGDWPVMPSFLVAIQELAKQAVGGNGRMLGTTVGMPLALPWSTSVLSLEFDITSPGGSSRKLSATRANAAAPFILDGFSEPGFHTVEAMGRSIRVAVNIPVEECSLDYLARGDLTKSALDIPNAYSEEHSQLRQRIEELRQGSPLWPILLLAAFVLSMVEVIFANLRSKAVEKPKLVEEILGKGGASL